MLNPLKVVQQRHWPVMAIGLVSLALQGCGASVDCNSSQSKADAMSILQSHMEKQSWFSDFTLATSGKPTLSNIKTVARNDELKSARCSGSFAATFNGKHREAEIFYNLSYLQDKRETEVRVLVDDALFSILRSIFFEPAIKNGVQKTIDKATGNLQEKAEWKDNLLDGVVEVYNPKNQQLTSRVEMSKGVRSGSQKIWDSTGKTLLTDLVWKDNLPTGVEKIIDVGTQMVLRDVVWKNGKATGMMILGNVESYSWDYDEYHVKEGIKEGAYKHYERDSGSNRFYVKQMGRYHEGELDGVVQELNIKGEVTKETLYKNGKVVPVAAPAVVQ